jgi:dTDP-4-dehydrorhamnose 3,5-epimerase
LRIEDTPLPGAKLITPAVFGDERGFFMETWNAERYSELGLDVRFLQTNLSRSAQGVLRGLHFQQPEPQGKLVWVLEGEVFDVAVDIRRGSPTFGQWHGVMLSADNRQQFYVPEGFAHGFCVTSPSALFAYACTRVYRPQFDAGIAWNDPGIGVDWPINKPSLSAKDQQAPRLADLPAEALPSYD